MDYQGNSTRATGLIDKSTFPYREKIRRSLLLSLRAGYDSFEVLCRLAAGAFPVDTYKILERLYEEGAAPRHALSLFSTPFLSDPIASISNLEPHLLDCDWRFSKETATKLALLASQGGKRILCLGTPSVFHELQKMEADATLIDRNHLLAETLATHSRARFVIADLNELAAPPSSVGSFDVVVMDPPWYTSDYRLWIQFAMNAGHSDTLLITTLLPELTRPSATEDRAKVLNLLLSMGAPVLHGSDLDYITPKFEQEVLSSFGLPRLPFWRTSEFVGVIMKPNRPSTLKTQSRRFAWSRFQILDQVVFLRSKPQDSGRITIQSPLNCPDFFINSVSARDQRRAEINFWTSRNRVATATGTLRIPGFLQRLTTSHDISSSINSIAQDRAEASQLWRLASLVNINRKAANDKNYSVTLQGRSRRN